MRTGLILLLCWLNGSSLSAQVYKWVDENGVTHYSQNKPADTNTTEIKVKGLPAEDQNASTSEAIIPVEVDCQKAVRHGSKLMVAAFQAEGGNSSLVDALTDPKFIIDTIAECNREIKDPAKAEIWLCQQNAVSVEEVEQCEYM